MTTERPEAMSEHDRIRLDLGAYALGALDLTEEARVAEHLRTCDACTAELFSFNEMMPLLGTVTEEELLAPYELPDGSLLERMLAGRPAPASAPLAAVPAAPAERPRRERPQRPRMWLMAAAAVAALLLVFGGFAGWLVRGTSAPSGVRTLSATDPVSHVSATVKVQPTSWGTWVQVKMANVPYGYWCRLIAVESGGAQEVASSWSAPEDGSTVTVPGGIGAAPAQVTRFDVVTTNGKLLVSLPMSS